MTLILEARGLSRSFGHVRALNDADFDINAGEVVALIGDNGAGKSTMVKALTGNLDLDSGELFFEGKPLHISTPQRGVRPGDGGGLPGPGTRPAPQPVPEHVPGAGDPAEGLPRQVGVHGRQGHARQGRGPASPNSAAPCDR